ncbi:hypothetical protein RRG08_050823 [Elysia crispata]|uniref:Uncharacterized protein n=1 Tax=Elysia crispata TaxID=231223 RepID=A0AAE1DY38_9GAST|nr:hypothetical protein RRG08_050823 [Elysia crispata]
MALKKSLKNALFPCNLETHKAGLMLKKIVYSNFGQNELNTNSVSNTNHQYFLIATASRRETLDPAMFHHSYNNIVKCSHRTNKTPSISVLTNITASFPKGETVAPSNLKTQHRHLRLWM